MLINLLLALVPIGLFLLMLHMLGSFSLVKGKLLALAFCAGILCCAVLFAVAQLVGGWEADWISPVVEELLKASLAIALIGSRKVAFVSDAAIVGGAVGGSFAFLENILYVLFNPEMTASTALFRGLGAALMHTGCTAGVAMIMVMSTGVWQKAGGVVLAICLHIAHNLFILPPVLSTMVWIGLVPLIIMTLFSINENKIRAWMDDSLANDVNLLGAIRTGNFRETPAGQYMLMLKDKFKPEVFFDMCCYTYEFLELSIAAKSRVIMLDAGIDMPLDKKVKAENQSRINELAALKKNIGFTAESALRPIVNLKEVDNWILNSLI